VTPNPSSFLVIAPNWLGDAVMALPALVDVRREHPNARLVVAARRPVADLFSLVPDVDEVVTLHWDGRWWRRAAFLADAARLAAVGAAVALLLPNSFASAWVVRRASVPQRWGYDTDARGWLLTRSVRRPEGRVHQGAYYQHLVSGLGIPTGPLQPRVTVPVAPVATARQALASRGWNGERALVALAPGAAYGSAKRWPPAHVSALAAALVGRGATCVLVGSAADQATTSLVREGVAPDVRAHVVDLAGETTLETLAGVLRLARVCVSNDSGAMHLAAAVGVPVVALFGPTREDETAPLTRADGRVTVLTEPVACRPCMLRECPIDHRCLVRLEPERVFGAVEEMMQKAVRA